MTKQEYLDSLPFHRKAGLYINWLECNKYWGDLETIYEVGIEEAFDENDFNSYGIADMIERHSSYLTNEEWEVYQELDNGDLLF